MNEGDDRMSNLKVLRVIYDLQIGGVQRMLLLSLPILRDMGIDTEICCLKGLGELAEKFKEKEFRLHVAPFKSRFDPVGIVKLRRLAQKGGYDIIHSHMYASNMAVNAALFGKKNIRIVNSYHSQRPFHGAPQKRKAAWLKSIPDKIVAVSEAVLKPVLENGFPEEKTIIIHNGIKCPDHPSTLPEVPADSPLRLIWAGRFVKQKRVEMLVDIAEACRNENIPVHITIVGDGPTFQRVKASIKEKTLGDSISLTGWKSDISPYINEAELYISASNREGFPNTLLEMCARGRGCVVADIPPNREALGDSGAGLTVKDDLSAWTDALESLYRNRSLIPEMSRKAYKIGQTYTVENTCSKTIRMYEELMAEKKKLIAE